MAIGTSDGKEYPSQLEYVLSSLDSSGKNKIDEGRVERNKAYEEFRDENDNMTAPPATDMRRSIKVAENKDIRQLFPDMPAEERKAWEQGPPRDLQFEYQGNSKHLDIPKTLDLPGHEDGLFTDQFNPQILKLPQDQYEIRNVPGHDLFHIRKQVKPPLVGEDDSIPPNARPVQYMVGLNNQDAADKEMKLSPEEKNLYDTHLRNLLGSGGVDNEDGSRSTLKATTVGIDDKTYILPSVVNGKILEDTKDIVDNAKKVGLDKFPAYSSSEEAEKRYDQLHSFMEKDTQNFQEVKGVYNKVTDFLDNLSDMKGAENWSPKHVIGYALSQAMNAIGINNHVAGITPPGIKYGGGGPKAGFSDVEFPRDYWVANDNVPGKGKADAAMSQVEKMTNQQFKDYLATRERDFVKNGGPPKDKPSIDEILGGLKNADQQLSPYDQAVLRQQSRKKLEVIENPPQEPQVRFKPTQEQIDAQRAQRAEQKASEYKVDVGPGKGVLNNNREEVMSLLKKGYKPSELADKYDITPNAVRSWLKNQPERIADTNPAAVQINGKIYRGNMHYEAVENAAKELGVDFSTLEHQGEGFVTSKGRFVSREEAAKIAKGQKQLGKGLTSDDVRTLLSEDLMDDIYFPHRSSGGRSGTSPRRK